LWQGLAARGDGGALRDALLVRYGEPARHYHGAQHLWECLGHFASARSLAHEPAELEAALWFHDAIYDPVRHDNEERSAAWAGEALRGAGVPLERIARIAGLILATRHFDAGAVLSDIQPDVALLLDIDLAILGAQPARFAEYEGQIRREYAFVPDDVYNARRSAVLEHFAARDPLFRTVHFHNALGARAYDNLRAAAGSGVALSAPRSG
jgi:predicted metal-dependent HD superfamily phosphohydrolase